MNKVLLALLLLIIVSCKNESKQKNAEELTKEVLKEEKKENILSEAVIPEFSQWFSNKILFNQSDTENYNGEMIYLMEREDASQPGYSGINNIKIRNGSTYKFSVIVKRASIGKNFALRLQGVYPNRVDAVFDLETGLVKESIITGAELAENDNAIIESIGDGWYKCSLYADVFADYVRVVFGPTTNKLKTGLWETRTGEKSNTLIVPTSLKLEEL